MTPHGWSPVASVVSAVVAAVLLCASRVSAGYFQPSEWWNGRVTRYGGPGDGWSIHDGYCGYGYLDQWKSTGWDVAAIADADGGSSGACGRCYEIACQNMVFKDNYGQTLDRSNVCYDQNASVVVQITDLCPCNYPANAYSNKRWCCGDMYHLDLSHWTFEKLADQKWGVIGVKVRTVPCSYRPQNEIRKLSNPTPGVPAPSGWQSNWDKRPWS